MYAFPRYIEEIDTFVFTSPGNWTTFDIPKDKTFIQITCIGAGGGGGGSSRTAPGTTRAGGCGGGSGCITTATFMTSVLPSQLYLFTGVGGAGGASGGGGTAGGVTAVTRRMNFTAEADLIVRASGGAAGTAASGSTAATAPTPTTNAYTATAVPFSALALASAVTNGAISGGNGVGTPSITVTGSTLYFYRAFPIVTAGGNGGASTDAAAGRGQSIAVDVREPFTTYNRSSTDPTGSFLYVNGGSVSGGAGEDGLWSWKPLYGLGGAGGAGSTSGTGGRGGDGAYGCGGGSCGAGSTSGAAAAAQSGRGGDGLILINCW